VRHGSRTQPPSDGLWGGQARPLGRSERKKKKKSQGNACWRRNSRGVLGGWASREGRSIGRETGTLWRRRNLKKAPFGTKAGAKEANSSHQQHDKYSISGQSLARKTKKPLPIHGSSEHGGRKKRDPGKKSGRKKPK